MLPEVARRIGRTRGHLGGALARGRDPRPVRRRRRAVGVAAGRARARSCARRAGWPSWWRSWRASTRSRGGMLTPVFQIPDETYHTSYVQDLAEHGKPPRAAKDGLSLEMYAIIDGAQVGAINFNPFGRGRWSPDAEVRLDKVLADQADTGTTRARAPTSATTRPRTTRALVPAYASTHAAGGSTLDALTFMRAIGALFAMVTVLALLAMLRELFPDRPLLTGGVALIVGVPARLHLDLRRRQPGRRADPGRRRAVLADRARAAPRADGAGRGGHRARRRARRADQARRARAGAGRRARRRAAAVEARAGGPAAPRAGSGGRLRDPAR